jgi:hypothetical protein
MIQVALDWNCIIALEKEDIEASSLRKIQSWHEQGYVNLCLTVSSMLENPQDRNKAVIEMEEWTRKLKRVGLEGIEIRWPKTRAFTRSDGFYCQMETDTDYDHGHPASSPAPVEKG